jgi:hypothetical protein
MIVGVEMRAIVSTLIKSRLLSNEDTNNIDSWDWDENRNFQYIHMRPVWIKQFIPLPTIFLFTMLLWACIVPKPRAQPRPRSEMYLCLHTSRSKDSRFGPVSGMTSERSEQFFVPVHRKFAPPPPENLPLPGQISQEICSEICPSP